MASSFDEGYSRLDTLGMDETSATKGHDYITLFVDLMIKAAKTIKRHWDGVIQCYPMAGQSDQ